MNAHVVPEGSAANAHLTLGDQHRPQVLLVEDNPGDARLIELFLQQAPAGFDLTWVQSLAAGLRHLVASRESVDAVLLDLGLPDSVGFATFASLRSAAPDVAIVVLTGRDDEELAAAAMRAGAQDYLVKGGVEAELLRRSIEYAIERKRAEQALRENEEKLRLALEASESAIWDYDVRLDKVTLSPGYAALLGYEVREVSDTLDGAWTAMIHPDDRATSFAALTDVLSGALPSYECDHRLRRMDGSWLWVQSRGRVVARQADGQPLRLIITSTNISARKAAETAAYENGLLYEAQREIATTLQQNFLHPLPNVPGWEFGLASQPASRAELIGGDFHDVFALGADHVAILLGDVEGKGLTAAGMTETVHASARALATFTPSPSRVLARLNGLLVGEDSRLVTALFAVVHRRRGVLRIASAGHPAPLHLRRDGTVEPLRLTPGLPLGAFAESRYALTTERLKAGEALVLFTDGVTDARRNNVFFGDANLLATVRRLAGASAQAIADGLRDAAFAYGDSLRDDVHVLVVRRSLH